MNTKLLLALLFLPLSLFGQSEAVLKDPATNVVTEPLTIPAGSTITSSTLVNPTISGTLEGDFGLDYATPVEVFSRSGTTNLVAPATLETRTAVSSKLTNFIYSGTQRPLRVLVMADSLGGRIEYPPGWMYRGSAYLSAYSGTSASLSTDYTLWPNGVYANLADGGSYRWSHNGQSAVRVNKVWINYLKQPGNGDILLESSTNSGSSWQTVATISGTAASLVGAWSEYSISGTNRPSYIFRTTASGGPAQITGVGGERSGGWGVVESGLWMTGAGLNFSNMVQTPSAIVTPILSGYNPDLIIVIFSDGAADWETYWPTFYATVSAAAPNAGWVIVNKNPQEDEGIEGTSAQAIAQIAWCRANGATWIDGSSALGGDYDTANLAGMMSDPTHPSGEGKKVRDSSIWEQLLVGHTTLGRVPWANTTASGPAAVDYSMWQMEVDSLYSYIETRQRMRLRNGRFRLADEADPDTITEDAEFRYASDLLTLGNLTFDLAATAITGGGGNPTVGKSTARWANMYTVQANLSGNLTMSGGTIISPGSGGTMMVSSLSGNGAEIANGIWGVSNGIRAEGATANGVETTISFTDPTVSSKTITVPDASGNMAVTLSGTAALNFDLTASASQDLTITVTGAALGEAVAIGVPHASVTADTMFYGWVSAADTVTVRALRIAGTPDPESGTFRATVFKN